MRRKPPAELRHPVRAVVIRDDVDVAIARQIGLQPIEESQEFLVAVPAMALSNHVARRDVEGREERRRPVTNVVMRLLHRNAGRIGNSGRVRSALGVHSSRRHTRPRRGPAD